MGDPIFFVLVKGGANDKNEKAVQKSASDLASSLGEVMKLRRTGQTGDVHGGVTNGGEASITSIGADTKALILPAHLQSIEEQIVAGTGIPAGLFSLSWSARESMLEGQTDILVSKIWGYRSKAETVFRQCLDLELVLNKLPGLEYTADWPAVNLQDDLKTSTARLNNATAKQTEIMNTVTLVGMGVLTQEEGNADLVGKGLTLRKPSNEWWEVAIKNMLAAKAMRNIFYVNE
jgi:hypothetical protein